MRAMNFIWCKWKFALVIYTSHFDWIKFGIQYSQETSLRKFSLITPKHAHPTHNTAVSSLFLHVSAELNHLHGLYSIWTTFYDLTFLNGSTLWRSWLRHCAVNRKVEGSILDGVIRIFHWHNPSGRTMDLWSTQPVTEMSTGIFPGV